MFKLEKMLRELLKYANADWKDIDFIISKFSRCKKGSKKYFKFRNRLEDENSFNNLIGV